MSHQPSPTELSELAAAVAQMTGIVERLRVVLGTVEAEMAASVRFIGSPMHGAMFEQAVRDMAYVMDSPFIPRAKAHLRWGGSEGAIDHAVKMGVLTPLQRASGVVFEKSEGDQALRAGRWPSFDAKVAARLASQKQQERKAA